MRFMPALQDRVAVLLARGGALTDAVESRGLRVLELLRRLLLVVFDDDLVAGLRVAQWRGCVEIASNDPVTSVARLSLAGVGLDPAAVLDVR
jgi:hypothetical protein